MTTSKTSHLELRMQIMATKDERQECEHRIQTLSDRERALREELQGICGHELTVGIRGDAVFDRQADGIWFVRDLIPPFRLCCGCGLEEMGALAPERTAELCRLLLHGRLGAPDLLEKAASYQRMRGQPAKLVYRDVYLEFVRRFDLRDPLLCGPVIHARAPTAPLIAFLVTPPDQKPST